MSTVARGKTHRRQGKCHGHLLQPPPKIKICASAQCSQCRTPKYLTHTCNNTRSTEAPDARSTGNIHRNLKYCESGTIDSSDPRNTVRTRSIWNTSTRNTASARNNNSSSPKKHFTLLPRTGSICENLAIICEKQVSVPVRNARLSAKLSRKK